MKTQETEPANLDLDTSVLTEQGNALKHAALMDLYGVRILDQDIEKQINEYQQREQQKIAYYKAAVFLQGQGFVDKEFNYIRENVFSVPQTSARSMETKEYPDDFRQLTGFIVSLVLLILLTGICYGKLKQIKRGKKLADINNRYDE